MYSVTALLPRFSLKRRAWNVGVLAPAVRVVPGTSVRPLSPIRQTYTSAVGFSDRATSGAELPCAAAGVAVAWRAACLALDLAALVLVVPFLEEPPPEISSTI